MTESVFFLFMGGVLLIGFVANWFFRITRVPPSLICLLIGIIMGPVLGTVDSARFATAASYFGGLALIIIMFEGGLDFDLEDVMRSLSGAVLKGILGCVITAAGIMSLLFATTDMATVTVVLLAVILSCNSPAVVLPVLNLLGLKKQEKTLLSLESTVGEIFMVVAAVLLLETIRVSENVVELASVSVVATVGMLLYEVGVSAALGFAFGMVWHRLMLKWSDLPLSHFLTLGIVMFVYGLTELMGGKGVLSALAFGLAFRNAGTLFSRLHVYRDRIRKRIPIPEAITRIDPDIHRLTADLSFLVRTFFFVYLGLILDLQNLSFEILGIIVGISVIIVGARWLNAFLNKSSSATSDKPDVTVSLVMVPRGLANAVIGIIAFRTLERLGVAQDQFDELLPIISGTILFSNLFMAPLILVSQRREREKALAEAEPPKVEKSSSPEK